MQLKVIHTRKSLKKMNVTVSTSKSQFSRAKAMLREKITELEK